ncbi:exported hypothetical protein [Vibrio nigripulchritudo SOn1]|uniref:Uncharacterized protein n=1 Tax=Vibrio nigripulchritudo SOn1 TaxID=1238450 RepID=A0AAV2VQ77_9VIBR|nr:hypothetical protein [Vibrio nigripulchritudo]CCO46816.1 exported hypothetical protein [Vibrio nigripulchritudo SOn1]
MTLIRKAILASLVTVVAHSATGSIITLEQAEDKRIEIMDSDRTLKQKLEELKLLNQVLEENQKIIQKLGVDEKSQESEPEPPKQETTELKFALPQGWNMNTVFVSEIFGIGNDISAEIFVNGEALPPIDVVAAQNIKEKFGPFIITGHTPTTITFKNTEDGKVFTRRVVSAEQIAKKIEHNNSLNQQYQERYSLGTLEARLENYTDSNRTPVEVNYETQAFTPPVFDTMQGK